MNNLNHPLFSVVIPAYNRTNVIKRAIDSVLSQTFTDFEIIIVDDGSDDNLKKYCDDYNSSYIYYYRQEYSGSNPARNSGIRHSRGYYVSFLDSDDAWEPEYLNEVYKKFSQNDEYGFVWVKHIKKYLPNGPVKLINYKKLEGNVYKNVLKQGFLINSSCISAKKSLLESIGGWDNDLQACQDDDICFRLSKITKVGYVDKTLSTFYIDERIDRISASNSRRAWNSYLLWQKFADDVIQLCGKNELKRKFIGIYSSFLIINNKEWLEQCEQFLFLKLNFNNMEKNIFFIKCWYTANKNKFKIKIKNIIRKLPFNNLT